MFEFTIRVPEAGCYNCKYLQEVSKDHNYYGETETKLVCRIFNREVQNHRKCIECLSHIEAHAIKKHEDMLRLADEVEGIVAEALKKEDTSDDIHST